MAKNPIYTGGGKLYFEKLNSDGSYEPMMYFGKTDGITFSTSIEWKDHYDTEGCTPVLDAKYVAKKSADVKFSTSEITLEMLNRAFLGTLVDSSQSAVTNEAIVVDGTKVKVGYIVDTGYYNATSLLVTDSTDSTTYVEGTDYSFDAKSGYITILEGGAIFDGEELHLTISAPAITMRTSATLKESALTGRFIVVTSSQTGNNYKYVFKKVSVTQDGDFALKGEEIGTISFAGSAMVDSVDNGLLSDYLDIIELDTDAC